MAKVAGIWYVAFDGTDFGTKSVSNIDLGGNKKTSQFASNKRTGSSQEPKESSFTVVIENTAALDISYFDGWEGEITLWNDIGQTWTIPNAETMDGAKPIPGGGGIEIMVAGDKAIPS